MKQKLLSLGEMADATGLSKETIRHHRKLGKFPMARKIGRNYVYPAECVEILNNRKNKRRE